MLRRWIGFAALLVWTGTALGQQFPGMPGGFPTPGFGQSAQAAKPGIYGGAALHLLGTYADHSTAFITTTDVGTAMPAETITAFPIGYQTAPEFWIGGTLASGVGLRGRYFVRLEEPGPVGTEVIAPAAVTVVPAADLRFEEAIPGTVPNFGSPSFSAAFGLGTDRLTFSRLMRLHVGDVDVTVQHAVGNVTIIAGAGGRYMNLVQGLIATLENNVTPGMLEERQQLVNDRHFTGGGPTASLQLVAPIGGGALAGYINSRFSLVIGTMRETLTLTHELIDTGNVVIGSTNFSNSRSGSRGLAIPVAEVEAGLELKQNWRGFPLFLRGGVVGQTYFGAGSAVSRDGNLHLFGGVVALGVRF